MKWQEEKKTIPPQETPHGKVSPTNSESTDEEIAGTVALLTGQLLNLSNLSASLKMSLEVAQQSNLATPVTVVHLSSALLGTVSLSMNTCDLLRAYMTTWKLSPTIIKNETELWSMLWAVEDFLDDLLNDFTLF